MQIAAPVMPPGLNWKADTPDDVVTNRHGEDHAQPNDGVNPPGNQNQELNNSHPVLIPVRPANERAVIGKINLCFGMHIL